MEKRLCDCGCGRLAVYRISVLEENELSLEKCESCAYPLSLPYAYDVYVFGHDCTTNNNYDWVLDDWWSAYRLIMSLHMICEQCQRDISVDHLEALATRRIYFPPRNHCFSANSRFLIVS